MRKGAYGLWHGDGSEWRGRFLWPYVRGSRDDGREQGLMAEKYVSSYFSLSVQPVGIGFPGAVYLKGRDLRARGCTVKTWLHSVMGSSCAWPVANVSQDGHKNVTGREPSVH